jgi:GAF domain-containing protein
LHEDATERGLVHTALETKSATVTARVDHLPYDQGWLAEQQIRAAAAVPLHFAGTLEGLLLCLSGEEFTPERQELLVLAAAYLAATLREQAHHQLREAEQQQRAVRTAIAELVSRLASGHEAAEVLGRIVEAAVQFTGADEGSLVLEDTPCGERMVRACAGYKTPITGMTIPRDLGITGAVIASGETVEVEDYQTFPHAVPRIKQRGVRAAVGAPVRGRDGRVLGVLKLESKRQGFQFSRDEIALLEELAALASISIRMLKE